MEPGTSSAAYREHLERNLKFSRERLLRQARLVESIAANVAKRLEHSEDPIISELGEIQAQGTHMDTFCARYAMDRQALKDFDAFAAEALA